MIIIPVGPGKTKRKIDDNGERTGQQGKSGSKYQSFVAFNVKIIAFLRELIAF
jgi:hypothetical protein